MMGWRRPHNRELSISLKTAKDDEKRENGDSSNRRGRMAVKFQRNSGPGRHPQRFMAFSGGGLSFAAKSWESHIDEKVLSRR